MKIGTMLKKLTNYDNISLELHDTMAVNEG